MLTKVNRIYMVVLLGFVPMIITLKQDDIYAFGKIAVALVITMVVLVSHIIWGQSQDGLIKNTKYDRIIRTSLVIMVVTTIIATVISVDRAGSIMGVGFAPEGIVSIILCIAIFYVFYRYIGYDDKVIGVIMVLACIVVIVGVFEFLGVIAPVISRTQYTYFNRVNYSSIGNRNFFGTYSLLFFTIGLGLFIFKGKFKGLIYSGIFGIGIAVSQTRGVYLAALLVVILMIFATKQKSAERKRYLFLVVAMMGISIGTILYMAVFHQDYRIVARILMIDDGIKGFLADPTGFDRVGIWGETFTIMKGKWLFGAGPDTFGVLYDKYFGFVDRIYMKCHNEWLQMWLNCGIVYLGAYLTIVSMTVFNILKRVKGKNSIHRQELLIVLFCIIGYNMQGMLNISVAGNSFIYFALLGIGASQYNE